jgi:hypothetical protein
VTVHLIQFTQRSQVNGVHCHRNLRKLICPTGCFEKTARSSRSAKPHATGMRAKANLLNRIKSIPPVQSPSAKIFRLTRRANHFYNFARLARERGVGHRHERWARCGGRSSAARERDCRAGFPPVSDQDRARRAELKRTAKPCGPGTRCWCQVGGGFVSPTGFGKTINSPTTVTRRIRRRGEHDISR